MEMNAITYTEYGSPDVLRLSEVEKPLPKENEVLIKVQAASINPLDWHIMRASPWLARLSSGLFKPKIPYLGADVAGRVEAVGKGVTDFKVGDEVFGAPVVSAALGSLAEYVTFRQEGLVHKPANISFEEAAAVPVAAVTALQSLQHGKIRAGQRVLINGASGGVGTFTVQLARSFGAEVTGVCSSRNLELVRSIGADQVIDYTKEDFTRRDQKYDLLIDNVGNRTVAEHRRALAPKGASVIVGYTSPGLLAQHLVWAPFVSIGAKKKVSPMKTASINKQDLLTLKDLLQSGKIKSVIDRSYPLSETAEAMRYLEAGHACGKVVVTV